MIIYCDLQGNVSTVPSSVPMGTLLDDIVIMAPQVNATAILKIKPAYQEYIPDIICSPVLNDDHILVFDAKIPKSVTKTSGRAEYQVVLKDSSGKTVSSFMGSFNVSRGVLVDMPDSAEDLSDYTLEQVYTMLSNVTMVYNQLANVETLIGVPNETLETVSQTLISAINEINKTVKFHGIQIGTGEILVPSDLAAGESGLVGLANATRRALDKHVDQKVDVAAELSETNDPHGTQKAIRERISAHDQNPDAHESIRKAVNTNAESIKTLDGRVTNYYSSYVSGLADAVSSLRQEIDRDVANHNTRTDSHPFIREKIAENTVKLAAIQSQVTGEGVIYTVGTFELFKQAVADPTLSLFKMKDSNIGEVKLSLSELLTGDRIYILEPGYSNFYIVRSDRVSSDVVPEVYQTVELVYRIDGEIVGYLFSQSVNLTNLTHLEDGEGESSVAQLSCQALGLNSFAEGYQTNAEGDYAHAEGMETNAAAMASHTEGCQAYVYKPNGHAEGQYTRVWGQAGHAEGSGCEVCAAAAHAEGKNTFANAKYSHTEGYFTEANAEAAHAEGGNTFANAKYSHVEGAYCETDASSVGGHAEGYCTKLIGAPYAHAECYLTYVAASYAHGEGCRTTVSGTAAHAEGCDTTAEGSYSHAEGIGIGTYSFTWYDDTGDEMWDALKIQGGAKGPGSHSEGLATIASGSYSHAEGMSSYQGFVYNGSYTIAGYIIPAYLEASGLASHAEGYCTVASGIYAHAEGGSIYGDDVECDGGIRRTLASGLASHAEGASTHATNEGSHSEGMWTTASGKGAHAEGWHSVASGAHSHVGGNECISNESAEGAFLHGLYLITSTPYQAVFGEYNKEDPDAAVIVGNGTSEDARNNLFVIKKDGSVEVNGEGLSAKVVDEIEEGNKTAVTSDAVYRTLGNIEKLLANF